MLNRLSLNELRRNIPIFSALLILSFSMVFIGRLVRVSIYGETSFNQSIGIYKTIQLFFSYQELGFVRRGLLGSILYIFKVESPDRFALNLSILIAILLTVFFWFYFFYFLHADYLRKFRIKFSLFVVFLPTSFIQVGYDLGRSDQLMLIIFMLAVIMLDKQRYFITMLLCSVALLIHEAFLIIFLPLVLSLMFLNRDNLSKKLSYILLPALTFASLLQYGSYEGGIEDLKQSYTFLSGMSYSMVEVLNVEKSFDVLVGSFNENIKIVIQSYSNPLHIVGFLLCSIFVICLAKSLFLFDRLILAACFSPLILLCIGYDFYRWFALIGMSLLLMSIYSLSIANKNDSSDYIDKFEDSVFPKVILMTSFYGPIGVGIPFPLLVCLVSILNI